MKYPSHARVLQELRYDPLTGFFFWRRYRVNRKMGQPLGSKLPNGYLTIRLDGKTYYNHQLAWLYVTGEWPKSPLDHANREKDDNRFENLRLADHSKNSMNTDIRINSSTGVTGVYFNPVNNNYNCYITLDGVRYRATKQTLEEAKAWRLAMEQKLYGEFSPSHLRVVPKVAGEP